jgi:two-component system, cell cycle sensor histidine kinase and response regulator CckA
MRNEPTINCFQGQLFSMGGKEGCEGMIATAVALATKQTILLVDDDDPVRDLAARILKRAGYDILTAVNGKEALKIYTKEHGTIALVILDLIMPEMGGKECLGELLKIDPAAKVIISTGASADDELKEAVKPYAMALVNKPYEISRLLDAVQAALQED